jgi:hypothetical protein
MTHGGIQLVPNASRHVLSTNLDINAINAIGQNTNTGNKIPYCWMNFSFRQLAKLTFPHIFQTSTKLHYHPFFLHCTIIVPFLKFYTIRQVNKSMLYINWTYHHFNHLQSHFIIVTTDDFLICTISHPITWFTLCYLRNLSSLG